MNRLSGIKNLGIVVLMLLPGSLANASVVSQWTFDGNANDSYSLSNGTVQGTGYEYVAGHDGLAIHFTDFTTNVNIGPAAEAFSPGRGDFTFTGWFRMSSTSEAASRYPGDPTWVYMNLVNDALNNVEGVQILLGRYGYAAGAGAPSFNVKGSGTGGNVSAYYTTKYDDDEWHWIGCRVNNLQMTLWMDGVQVASATYADGTTMLASLRDTVFGGGHDDFYLDEFTTWDNALSDAEMYANYIPEPATMVLLTIGGLISIYRKR